MCACAGKRQVPGLSPNGTTIRLGQLPDTPELMRMLGFATPPGSSALQRGAPPYVLAARVSDGLAAGPLTCPTGLGGSTDVTAGPLTSSTGLGRSTDVTAGPLTCSTGLGGLN